MSAALKIIGISLIFFPIQIFACDGTTLGCKMFIFQNKHENFITTNLVYIHLILAFLLGIILSTLIIILLRKFKRPKK